MTKKPKTCTGAAGKEKDLPSMKGSRAEHTTGDPWSLDLDHRRILNRRQIIELNRELQSIIDEMAVPMPDVKADVVLLCEQADVGRRCLRDHYERSKG
jgi:hypothetical protein